MVTIEWRRNSIIKIFTFIFLMLNGSGCNGFSEYDETSDGPLSVRVVSLPLKDIVKPKHGYFNHENLKAFSIDDSLSVERRYGDEEPTYFSYDDKFFRGFPIFISGQKNVSGPDPALVIMYTPHTNSTRADQDWAYYAVFSGVYHWSEYWAGQRMAFNYLPSGGSRIDVHESSISYFKWIESNFFEKDLHKNNLTTLDLSDSVLSACLYAKIGEMERLDRLALPAIGQNHLEDDFNFPPNIRELVLTRARLDNKTFLKLSALSNLRRLVLHECWVDVSGNDLRKMEDLCSRFSDGIFGHLCNQIEDLTLINCAPNMMYLVQMHSWSKLTNLTSSRLVCMSILQRNNPNLDPFPFLDTVTFIVHDKTAQFHYESLSSMAEEEGRQVNFEFFHMDCEHN